MLQRLRFARETHNRLQGGLRPQMMMNNVAQGRQSLRQLQDRQNRAVGSRLQQKRQSLETLSHLMKSLGYQNVLARGFALVRDEEGEMVRSSAQLSSGDRVNVEFVDGKVLAEIQGEGAVTQEKSAKKEPSASKPKTRAKPKKKDDGSDGGAQGSLF